MNQLGGILLGLIDIGIVIAVLVLVGLLIQWVLKLVADIDIPAQLVKVYLIIVALIALAMIVALLLGLPRLRVISEAPPFRVGSPAVAALPEAAAVHLQSVLRG